MINYTESFHLNNRDDALEYIGEHQHYKFYEIISPQLFIMSFTGGKVSLYFRYHKRTEFSILLSNNKIFLGNRDTLIETPCSLIDSLYMTLPR
jgi:hypothetical protein